MPAPTSFAERSLLRRVPCPVRIALTLAGLLTTQFVIAQSSARPLSNAFAAVSTPRSSRPITARDLLGLRDVAGLSVSPDGRYAAFQVQAVDLEANGFELGWFVVEVERPSRPVHVGDPGQPIWLTAPTGRKPGAPVVLTARWSPDSEWIAYLCRERDEVQLCRSRRDGKERERLTDLDADVEDLIWSADGTRIVFAVDRSRAMRRALEAKEAAAGFLLDDRFDVFHSLSPIRYDLGEPKASRAIRAFDLATRVERDATPEEIAWFESARPSPVVRYVGSQGTTRLPTVAAAGRPPRGPLSKGSVTSPPRFAVHDREHRRLLWFAAASPEVRGLYAPLAVFAARSDGTPQRCAAPACTGLLTEAWWGPDGREVFFLKREGWAVSRSGLYAWTPETDNVRMLLDTPDLLSDCALAGTAAVCFHEAATVPKRIVRVDLTTGEIKALVDPNPEYRELVIAPAERLEWQTPGGDQAFGYLVKPADTSNVPGRLPLIIVQYRATGFLKGGVGDEYPIQLFASHGFAVLAFDKPNSWTTFNVESELNAIEAREWRDLTERRRALAAIESGIDVLERRGVIDPCRVAITGLSDGAETTTFALIHSRRFAAAAASSGGWDPLHYYLEPGHRRATLAQRGLGRPGTPAGYNWQHAALALNADHINTPLLVQVSDRELLLMMQLYATFKDLAKPIEVYVFPDEYHQKWQPQHRLHIYERTVDWFRFWLQTYEDPIPQKRAQYARWRAMRTQVPLKRCERGPALPARRAH